MKEQAVVFGQSLRLVGLLSEPSEPASSRGPAFLLLNAGLLHRVGPNRLYVTLARRLAEEGVTTLRFDIAGLGDSPTRSDQLNYADGAVADTIAAMDYLQAERGFDTFVLGGLCSGADQSFHTAVADSRVVGNVLLDWYAYRTLGFYLRFYGPKILRVGPWLRTMRRMIAHVAARTTRPATEGTPEEIDPFARYIPPQAQVASALDATLERGVRILCVYTGGQQALNHQKQFERMFSGVDLRGLVDVHFLSRSTHSFTLLQHRRAVEEIVSQWASKWREEGCATSRTPT